MTPTPWIQVYDPLASPWLSTAAAALPIVLLLVTLGWLEWRAHMAALAGLLAALFVSTVVFGMPLTSATATAVYGAAYGFLPIGWIILNAVFLYNLTVATGQFEIVKASVGRCLARSADTGTARRVFIRRVHRRRVRFRHAGRYLRGPADRSRLHAALRGGAVAHRQHGAGRVRRDRHADPDARGRHRAPRAHDWHDGRPSTAVRLADRSRLAGGDDERVARLEGGLAGGAGVRRDVRGRAVRLESLRRSRARGHRRRPGVDRRARDLLRVWQPREVWEFAERRAADAQSLRPSMAPSARRRADAGVDAVAVSQRRGDPVGPRPDEGAAQRRTGGLRVPRGERRW